MRLHLDTETFSEIKLSHGVKKYSTGKAEVMIVTWALDDAPVSIWQTKSYVSYTSQFHAPPELIEAVLLADEIWTAGNDFDRTLLETCHWWRELDVPDEKWCDLHALARAHSLPAGLDKLCKIFKLDDTLAKSDEGRSLIQLFCVPQQDGKPRATEKTHPAQWAEFCTYAKQDIVAMRAVMAQMPFWNWTPYERAIQRLDAIMNRRGLRMDMELAEAMVKCTTRAKRRLGKQTEELTAGEVERTTQRNKLLAFILAAYDITLPDLTMDTVERRLNDPEIPEPVKELLRNRQQASKASTAKCVRVIASAVEERLYGLLVYCGADRTRRWAGRIFQPHNLPRPKHSRAEIETAIEAFKLDEPELVFDDIMGMAASMLRSLPIAADGHKLAVADLSNIEGVALAYMAGEDWKVKAFADYFYGDGLDLYIRSFANSFRMDPKTVTKAQRQIGKVQELALQYYGGVGAFISMSEVYNIDLDAMAELAWPSLRKEDVAQATIDYKKAGKRNRHFGLAEKTWIVCQVFVLGWRRAHPAIMAFHKAIEDAVISAIGRPRQVFKVRGFKVDRVGNWLRIQSPQGGYLCYPGIRYDADKREISYLGQNQYTRQFSRIKTYSGKITQNLTEFFCRDILGHGMLDAEAEGWRPVLTVHDELVCEPPDEARFAAPALCKILIRERAWAPGLPLNAKGFTAYRYRKDET